MKMLKLKKQFICSYDFLGMFDKYNEEIKNIDIFVKKIVVGIDKIKWVIENPLHATITINNYLLDIFLFGFVIVIIVSIIARMFTGENELKKSKEFFKNSLIISFILKLVLNSFLLTGIE